MIILHDIVAGTTDLIRRQPEPVRRVSPAGGRTRGYYALLMGVVTRRARDAVSGDQRDAHLELLFLLFHEPSHLH